jgi:hypothetical protein
MEIRDLHYVFLHGSRLGAEKMWEMELIWMLKFLFFVDGILEFLLLGSGKMEGSTQRSRISGSGSVELRSSFLMDMVKAKEKKEMMETVFVFFSFVFSAAKRGLNLLIYCEDLFDAPFFGTILNVYCA